MKEIDIYSLGEWDVFWAVIHNFLGWAHECTYYTTKSFKPQVFNPDERHRELLQKVAEKGGTLHVHHLFKAFVDSDLSQYQRKFTDNGIRLIRTIVKIDGLKVNWDITDAEKDILCQYSPPLYNHIFKSDKIWHKASEDVGNNRKILVLNEENMGSITDREHLVRGYGEWGKGFCKWAYLDELLKAKNGN